MLAGADLFDVKDRFVRQLGSLGAREVHNSVKFAVKLQRSEMQ